MLISIVFITIRPGVYDMLFNSLAGQTYRNYELIVVDDAHAQRREKVLEYAKLKQIPLAYYGPSKEKTYPENKFCYANAMNTGIGYARGDITLFVQDFCWLPPILLETIFELYSANKTLCLLSFQEILYQTPVPRAIVNKAIVAEAPLFLFEEEMVEPPPMHNFKVWQGKNPPLDVKNGMQVVPMMFWECFCSAINTSLIKCLNGFNEIIDKGDDCNEKDIMYRAKMLGVQSYICPLPIWQLNHHLWAETGEWKRFSEHTNLKWFGQYIQSMKTVQDLIPPNNRQLYKGLFEPQTIKTFALDDFRFCSSDLEADINRYTKFSSMLDKFKEDIMKARRMVDVGAHIGFFSVFAGKMNTGIFVDSYDASPFSMQVIEKNIVFNMVPNVCPHLNLVWDGKDQSMLVTLPTRLSTHYDVSVCKNGVANFYQKNENIKLPVEGIDVIMINISDCLEILQAVGPALAEFKPTLWILDSKHLSSIQEYLQTCGYSNFDHFGDFVRISWLIISSEIFSMS